MSHKPLHEPSVTPSEQMPISWRWRVPAWCARAGRVSFAAGDAAWRPRAAACWARARRVSVAAWRWRVPAWRARARRVSIATGDAAPMVALSLARRRTLNSAPEEVPRKIQKRAARITAADFLFVRRFMLFTFSGGGEFLFMRQPTGLALETNHLPAGIRVQVSARNHARVDLADRADLVKMQIYPIFTTLALLWRL